MEYVYAALLLFKAGKEITEETVTSTLKGAGLNPDPARVKALVAALDGVNIEEAIEKAAQPVAAAAAAAPAGGEAPAASEKKEEKKKEEKKSAEEAAAGLGALFG